jgi:stearoyl-CoA desaturase (delta-9 desaturase)
MADVSDLRKNPIVQWQHKNFIPILLVMGFLLPTVVAGVGWGDWKGGYYYAAVARLLFVHHVRCSWHEHKAAC